MEDLDLTDIWGEPKIYKGIKLYPVKMKDSVEFFKNVGCLTINKNNACDINIIQMSHLDFILRMSIIFREMLEGFIKTMQLSLRDQKLVFLIDNEEYDLSQTTMVNDEIAYEKYNEYINLKEVLGCKPKMKVYSDNKQIIINDIDFEKIRRIICKQNLIEINDLVLPEKIRQAIEEAHEFMDDGKNPTLEEQIMALACITQNVVNIKEIKEMTIYQFITALKRYSLIENSRIYGSALATGLVEIKGDIPTWLSHMPETSSLDKVTQSASKIKDIGKAIS